MGRLRNTILACGALGAVSLLAAPTYAQAQEPVQSQPQGPVQNTTRRVIVEEVPAIKPIKHVSAEKTHSRYPVPRYVSLKFGRVNGRQGPSLRHPALWQYQRRGLPLIVVAEMDIWRKVRDMHGDESWVRTQALSGKRTGVALSDVPLYSRPKNTSRVKAIAGAGALLGIVDCNDENWCQVTSDDGYKGWVLRSQLWGAEPLR